MKVGVIGAGVVGLATTVSLLDAGAEVTCYEAVGPMSQRSAGGTRIFRLGHERPELVERAEAARRRFGEWEARAGVRLIDPVGAAFCGDHIGQWARSMTAAGARVFLLDQSLVRERFPVRSLDGPVLFDPEGGVVSAELTGEVLVDRVGSALVREAADAVEVAGAGVRVRSRRGWEFYDALVIAAGAQTVALAEQVGLAAPGARKHHVRFTFALRDAGARPACLLDRSQGWRAGITSYQHLAAPGQWAVGLHGAPELDSWVQDRSVFTAMLRELTVEYVREFLCGVDAEPIGELYCDPLDGWGDGYEISRSGAALAVSGNNLFKLAPEIGAILADAALTGCTPPSTIRV